MKKYALNLSKGFIALVLLAGGGAKLAGIPELHQSFQLLGLPEWFGYFIGACEIAGGVAMFITPLCALAALGITIIMGGAIYFHILHTPLAEGVPALIVLILCIYVFLKTKIMMLKFSQT